MALNATNVTNPMAAWSLECYDHYRQDWVAVLLAASSSIYFTACGMWNATVLHTAGAMPDNSSMVLNS